MLKLHDFDKIWMWKRMSPIDSYYR